MGYIVGKWGKQYKLIRTYYHIGDEMIKSDKEIDKIVFGGLSKSVNRYRRISKTLRGKRLSPKLVKLFSECGDLLKFGQEIEKWNATDKDFEYFMNECVKPVEHIFSELAENNGVDCYRLEFCNRELYLTPKIKGGRPISKHEKKFIDKEYSVYTPLIEDQKQVKIITKELDREFKKSMKKKGERKTYQKECEVCGRMFTATRRDAAYCTNACRMAAKRAGVQRKREYAIRSRKKD